MTYQIPSNPADRATIKNAIEEASNSLLRASAESELRSETAKDMKEQFGIPVSVFNQLAKARFKNNIEEVAQRTEQVTDTYSLLFPSTTNHTP